MNQITSITKRGKQVISIEKSALGKLENEIGEQFENCVKIIEGCSGKIVFIGVGKSGNVGQKIAATMSSLGIPSIFLNPTDALHGSLGVLDSRDIVVLISNSGNTQEIVSLIPTIRILNCKIIAITQNKESKIAEYADCVYLLPDIHEADEYDLAPTTSTTVTLALGDALAVAISERRSFSKEQFGINHPAGTLGKRLVTTVKDVMHVGQELPIVSMEAKIIDVISEIGKKQLGVAVVTSDEGVIEGIITSGDLRRFFEKRFDVYDFMAKEVMNTNPLCIKKDMLAVDVLVMAQEKGLKANVMPVIDDDKHIEGIICINDIIRLGILH